MTAYLSGPMTGIPEYNYPAFNAAAARLRDVGVTVLNPAENFGGNTTRPLADYMREDIRSICRADAIVMLPGWRTSHGARLELDIALVLGLPVYGYSDGDPMLTEMIP